MRWEERERTTRQGLGSVLLVAGLAAGLHQRHRIGATRESCPPAWISDSDS